MVSPDNGWDEYKLLVMDTLKRIEAQQTIQGAALAHLSADLLTLKTEVKTAKWFGNMVLPAGVALAVSWIGRKLGL